MARLQRKKSQEEKRKKRQTRDTEADVSSDAEPSAGTPVPQTGAKRKPPVAPRRDLTEARAKSEPPGRVGGWFRQAGQFFREAKVELKKVAWPSRKQTVGSTVVVLILVFAIAAFLGLADMVLAGIVRWVLQ